MQISSTHITLFFVFVVGLAGVGGGLSLGYSIDDYSYASGLNDFKFIFNHVLTEGRFTQALFIFLFDRLGVELFSTYVFFGLFSILAMIFLSYQIFIYVFGKSPQFMVLSERQQIACLFLFSAIMLSHPFIAEIYTWKALLPLFALNSLTTGLFFWLLNRSYPYNKFMLPALIAIIWGNYPIHINYLFIGLLLKVAIDFQPKRKLASLRFFSPLVLGTALYFLLSFVIVKLLVDEPQSRLTLLSFSELPTRLVQFKALLIQQYLTDGAFRSVYIKLALVFMALTAFVYTLIITRQSLKVVIAYFLLLITILGVVTPLSLWWPTPRVLFHAGLIEAFIVVCCIIYVKRGRYLIFTVGALVALTGLLSQNQVLVDQLRLNKIDELKANRIIGELERKIPNIEEVQCVFALGNRPFYPRHVARFSGELNTSAFYGKAYYALLREKSGWNFLPCYDPAVQERAEALCSERKRQSLPLPYVTFIDRYPLICV